MNNSLPDSQAQALSHLEKAERYKESGLNIQVQQELEQARGLDPYIVHEARYKALSEAKTSQVQEKQPQMIPFRIGAGILFVNALVGISIVVVRLVSAGLTNLEFDNIVQPIFDILIGINLWQMNKGSQSRTIWWAVIGLVLFGGQALITGDYFGLIIQTAFDGSLILLLAGTPSKVRTTIAVIVFAVGYLGLICLGITALILMSIGVI